MYFRLHRPITQSPHDELIVSRIPKKKHKPNEEKPDEEEELCEEFMSKMNISNSVQYFLKRYVENNEGWAKKRWKDTVRCSRSSRGLQTKLKHRGSR